MSAKRAFSDEGQQSLDRYSDDFDSDDEKKGQKHKRTPTPKKSSNHRYYQDKIFGRGSGSLRSQAQGHSLRKGRGNGRGNSLSSEPVDIKKNYDSVATRVLSASRNRINELRNKIEEMKIKIRELEQENKLFKITQFRQEKTIKSFSDKDNDLPLILEKHNNEIRTMKDHNRRLREKYEKSDRYLRDAEDELEKVKGKMNKYKDICENKELIERDELSRRLATAEQKVEENDTRIKELQKHIEMLKKTHKHELGIEFARQKDLRKQLEELKESYAQLSNQLKEKDKALYYQNIHSNLRKGKSSTNQSPDSSLSWKTKRKTSSMTELTPREKAKFYSEKQRAELYKQRELKDEQDKRGKQKLEQDKGNNSQVSSDFAFKAMKEAAKDTEERTRWDTAVEKSNNDKEDMNELGNEKKELQRQPNKDKQIKQDREVNEAREREEREQKEKNKLEIQDTKKKADDERRQLLQMDNMESDFFLQEDRKKKDKLLKKLQAMNDPFSHPLAGKKSKDQASGYEGLRDSPVPKHNDNLSSTKSSYTTVTQQELQKSKPPPSNKDVTGYKPSFGPTRENINKPGITPTSIFEDNDDEPAFKINKTPSNMVSEHKDKKPNLLESLFGPQANSSKNLPTKKVEDNDPFFITEKPPNLDSQADSTTNPTFPWETHPDRTKSNKSTFDSGRKPPTMNGSTAMYSDGTLDNNNKTQARSQRQQNPLMFPAKPSVTAFDSFNDDIEEVVL